MLRVALASILALSLAPAAFADGGPSPGLLDGGAGVLSAAGSVRYVTIGSGGQTMLEAVRTSDGRILRSRTLPGAWGIPSVAYDGTAGGLSRNGRTLVLSEAALGSPLRMESSFRIIDPKTFGYETISLAGDFAYDALAPDGRMLYLIEHVSATNLSRYVVRVFDLTRGQLLPRVIADRTQHGWVMQGSPMARASSANWRFVYTLYQNPGGYPFVHALDTARGVAHCVGLPWTGDQSQLGALHLSVAAGGRTVAVSSLDARPLYTIDTRSYRVSEPGQNPRHPFPWWVLGLIAPVLVAAGAVASRRARRTLQVLTRLRRRTAPA